MPLFLSTYAVIFIAELPDKTALGSLVLTNRYPARAVSTLRELCPWTLHVAFSFSTDHKMTEALAVGQQGLWYTPAASPMTTMMPSQCTG